ncbi:unnamed protein product [Pleuronectes platessa]|uniref:Uncharacterized protein n=1 Tax=Pleuronectes platessa TaxID=8262 RepID=A0A9N7Y7C9_PLEPL|nr:unnamed protein product [Pleuronectes platessa]
MKRGDEGRGNKGRGGIEEEKRRRGETREEETGEGRKRGEDRRGNEGEKKERVKPSASIKAHGDHLRSLSDLLLLKLVEIIIKSNLESVRCENHLLHLKKKHSERESVVEENRPRICQ